MKKIDDIIVYEDTPLLDILKIIDKSSKQVALVVDKEKKLLGTISDGDVRRALLQNISLDCEAKDIYFTSPTVASVNDSRETIINICTSKHIYQIPIVDEAGNLIGIEILDELITKKSKSNKVVLMVGGLGTRLRPLTDNTPKPMLPVGGRPILQTIVEKFALYGFTEIIMCIGYKSNVIQDHFGDGSRFGVHIDYVQEDQRMGTAGALSLLNDKQRPSEPFFVMNGDLLTNVNFEHMLDFHLSANAQATMSVREYDVQIPYGVVKVENGYIQELEEKPVYNFFVSAGIYILDSSCLQLIPNNKFYDITTLFEQLINEKQKTISFPIREYWLDIGRMDEYEKANQEYYKVF